MATPFSQLVGIQALLNVVQGERYPTIPDENLMYLAGLVRACRPGRSTRTCSTRACHRARARDPRRRRPAAVPRGDPRATTASDLSDEELLLRYLIPATDVDAMYAEGKPVTPIVPGAGSGWVEALVRETRVGSISVSLDGVQLELHR